MQISEESLQLINANKPVNYYQLLFIIITCMYKHKINMSPGTSVKNKRKSVLCY